MATLKVNYAFLASRLAVTLGEPAARWQLLCDLAQIRVSLRSHRVRPWEYGLATRGEKAFADRMTGLLRDVIGHSRRHGLAELIPDASSAPPDFTPLLEEIDRLNRSPCAGTSLLRAVDGGFSTVQEDVLTQELDAMARFVGPPADVVRRVVEELALLRARETALACWSRLEGNLRALLPKCPRIFSIGAGLGEFEGILVREAGARVVCVDTGTVPRRRPEGLSQRLITPLEAYRPHYADADLLVLKDVLHHVRQPQWMLVASARTVRPGGSVLVMEPGVETGDRRSLAAIRELDSTPYKSSIVPHELWERWFRHAGLETQHRSDFPPGVVDNNDSFPRTAWLLRKSPTSA
ncbi:methyltransferase domain-containing protein [Streptomyces olivoreticuli]|uniref:class I SAM-dependent methyltransferase n=1 Tax=Streptomyces olivoreticuli TaxID=68246 RepID=UPI00265AF41D|nr:methyltransferase domain-containing protein [Streptomyces olivoreticuli]WKK23580.1 methyltransferase domain-containing protein [Streptomyces olivoreticuli]